MYEAFETVQRRKERIKELKGDSRVVPNSVQQYANASSITFGDAPSGSFMAQALDILKKEPTKESNGTEDKNSMSARRSSSCSCSFKLYLKHLFAKSMQKREGYQGYNEDSFEAFRMKAYDLARQVERLRYSNEISKVEDELRKAWATYKDSPNADGEKAQIVLDELLERAKFARNPPNDVKNRLAAQANRIAFLGTIGFNISSAIVNLSQVPLMVFPMLQGKQANIRPCCHY